jgi:hypothetical protein
VRLFAGRPLSGLTKLESGPQGGPERPRSYRLIQLLEQIGVPEAARFLADLAAGADGAMLTEEARAALERMRVQSY